MFDDHINLNLWKNYRINHKISSVLVFTTTLHFNLVDSPNVNSQLKSTLSCLLHLKGLLLTCIFNFLDTGKYHYLNSRAAADFFSKQSRVSLVMQNIALLSREDMYHYINIYQFNFLIQQNQQQKTGLHYTIKPNTTLLSRGQ